MTVFLAHDEDILLVHDRVCYLFDVLRHQVLPNIEEKLESCMVQTTTTFPLVPPPPSSRPYRVGRPEMIVDIEQVVHLRCLGFKWNAIADMIGISVRTLHCRRQDANVSELLSFTEISDEEVCRQLFLMKEEFPDIGEHMAVGLFKSKGIIIPRRRVRDAFHQVDTINTSLRWHGRIKKKPTLFPGSQCPLWHIG